MTPLRILIASTILPLLFGGCSEENRKVEDTGKAFLENLYTCRFRACDVLCTENGRKEVRWFASNLTEDDLKLILPDVEVKAERCEIADSEATALFRAYNVIVCDSLEQKGHIGERSLKVIFRKEKGTWKVDKLEW